MQRTLNLHQKLLACRRFKGCVSLIFILAVADVSGMTVRVSSIAELQSAINGAAAGDVLVLANGIYSNTIINISGSGIVLRAATPGGVILNGTNTITIPGNNNLFSGFQFTNGTILGIPIDVSGSGNQLAQLNFNGYSSQKYINLHGRSNEVSYCNFENKPTNAPIGNLIHIDPDPVLPGYNRIRYCSFKNMQGSGGDNGNECIRISNGSTSTYISRTLVEYCYFNSTGLGDSEVISVKCRENVLRYNTFTNNQDGMLSFRNGDNNIASGNFFIGAGGIRVKEANNIFCYNNYFEKSGANGHLGSVTYIYYTNNTLNVLSNINFFHNTFVECDTIDFDQGAKSNTWANNLFQKGSGSIFAGSATGIIWAGNIYTNTLGISIASGMTKKPPLLALNSQGYYGLSSNSPAIDASSTNYPGILDIAGLDDDPSLMRDVSLQGRPESRILKDVGCDEFTNSPVINHPLGLSDVGPAYLGGPPIAPAIEADPQDQTVTAGSPAFFSVTASGTAPLSYKWYKNGTLIAGANTATNSIAAAQTSQAGNYTVVVTNFAGSVTSLVAVLTVNSPPAITNAPASLGLWPGNTATFTVGADGTAPLSYQWWFNSTNRLLEATNAIWTVNNVQSTNAGSYRVVVTNAYGAVTSTVALLTLNPSLVVTQFTASGSWIWTCPTNVISVQAECWGGGGAGGSGWKQGANAWGGGGAGGAYAKNARIGVTSGTAYVISVGAGGVSVTNANAAVSGASSAFSYGATTNCLAVGGAGGVSIVNANPSGGVGGAAGSGTTNGCIGAGSVLYAGGSGAAGATSYGGGGGGGAGDNGSGANATNSFGGSGGSGLTNMGGAGGTGPNTNPSPGTNGVAPGGGGSGARASSTGSIHLGGTGGSGQVLLTYYFAPAVTSSAASGIGAATATLNGNAQDNGNVITNRGFFYRTTSGVTTNDATITAGSGSGAFTAAPILSPATRYYWKAYAINAGGMVLSPELDFVTASAAPPAFTSASLSADRSVFTLSGTGTANQIYVLQTASSLTPPAAWMPVATNAAATNGVFSFTDAQAGNYTQRFYRVMQP